MIVGKETEQRTISIAPIGELKISVIVAIHLRQKPVRYFSFILELLSRNNIPLNTLLHIITYHINNTLF